jgi:nucleobase transporter 1/2
MLPFKKKICCYALLSPIKLIQEQNLQVGKCVEIGLPMLILFVALSQYLKHVNIRHVPVLERFSLLMCIALVWVYAHILTASGAYKHTALVTQINCRTDRANLISSSQWFGDFPMSH